jgi:exodeoxyribonuclease VII small subunit
VAEAEHPQQTEPSFEEALGQLEAIVAQLESGQTGLEASLAAYERGVKLLRHCHSVLAKAERKIELLSRVSAAGEATTEPFDDQASLAEESPRASRSQKRSAPGRTAPRVANPRSEPEDKNLDDAPKLF